MSESKIILFICNWGPHTAYQTLQDNLAPIPHEIKMVRIPCSGRVSRSLLLSAFEMGADAVALLGCTSGSCRYGSGTQAAVKNTEDTGAILQILGFEKERLRLANFLPDEPEALLAFLIELADSIKALPPSPLRQFQPKQEPDKRPITAAEIVARHDVYACQECGKCTSACSLALAGQAFSPRALASAIIAGQADTEKVKKDVHACLTCGLCFERCPSSVNFPEFIKDMRNYYHLQGYDELPAHGGFFQSLMRTMAAPDLVPRRWTDLPQTIRIDPQSPILFFGGCAPYFDLFFRKFMGTSARTICEDSLRLLNFFDIEPRVLADERCCGHDLLWSGDRGNFLRLARLTAQSIQDSGVKEVITACPECYHTLTRTYAQHGIGLSAKITHIYQFLEQEIGKGVVQFKPLDRRITFQDSCRQSRLDQMADLPRQLLRRLNAANFCEMPESAVAAVCCGNSAWTGCGAHSKALQVKRLAQARQTGCDLLVTACPKCQIHLRCAMEDPFRGDELSMELMDLTSLVARTISWE
jgi:Fe-S oxidoreductase/coenzyme F420-reducing hydrogenase delta subunit